MTPTAGVPGAGGDAGVAYEALRNHVLTGVPGNGGGLVLLLREGLAAWLEGRSVCSPPSAPRATPSPNRHGAVRALATEVHASIVRVLANMILAGCPEEGL